MGSLRIATGKKHDATTFDNTRLKPVHIEKRTTEEYIELALMRGLTHGLPAWRCQARGWEWLSLNSFQT